MKKTYRLFAFIIMTFLGLYAQDALAWSPITGPSAICAGSSITFTDSTAGGTWSSSLPTVATVNPVTGVVVGVSAGMATISYGDSTGGYVIKNITVNPLPAPITGVTTICVGGTTTLMDATGGGAWSSSNTAVATISAAGVVTAVGIGVTTISYVSSSGCLVSVSVTVSSGGASAGTISGPSTVCAGGSITLTDSVSGGTWHSSNTAVATVSTGGIVTGIITGSVVIVYSVTSSCGTATASHTVTVTSGSGSAGTIMGGSAVCVGSTIPLTDSGATGGIWRSSDTTKASVSGTGSVRGLAAGTVVITYGVSGSCGTAYATHTVTVNPAPAAIGGGPTTICPGGTASFTDATGGGMWSSSATTVATIGSTTGIALGVALGTTSISYTLTTGCSASILLTVSTGGSAGTISGPSTVCVGGTISLTDSISGGAWSSSSGYATVSGAGLVTGISVGTAVITYTDSTSCGVARATHTVTVTSGTSAGTISGGSTVCVGSNLYLSDSGATGGTWHCSDTTKASVSAGMVHGLVAGTVVISYVVSGSCGTAVATRTVTVNPAPASISGVTSICVGGSTTLTDVTGGGIWSSSSVGIATISGVSGVTTGITLGTATITYSLPTGCFVSAAVTVGAGASAGTISGATTVCVGGTTPLTDSVGGGVWSSSTSVIATVSSGGLVTGLAAGVVTISYVVSSSCGTVTATHTMTVVPAPSVAAISGGTSVCVGASITLTDSTTGGSWICTDSTHAHVSGSGVVTGVAAGTVVITYMVSSTCGTSFVTRTITINPLPTITAGAGAVIVLGGSATLTATGGSTYTWAPPATLSSTVGASVRATPTVTTSYTVTGTSTLGCSNKAVETVTVTGSCGTPTGLSVSSISTSSAILSWGAIAGATEYYIAYKKATAGTWTNLLATSTSITITGLTAGTVYDCKVRSICGIGDSSGASSVDSFTTQIVCGTPSSISSSGVATTTATINWTAVTGATSYILAYKASAAGSWTTLFVTGTSHLLTGLTAATIYQYELRSVCGAGDSSSYTSYSTFTTLGGLPTCPTPTGLTSVIGGSIVTLSWTAVPGALGYQVNYQLVTHGTPTYLYSSTNAIAISGLALASSYEYKVRTICAAGDTSSASGYTTFRDITSGVNELSAEQTGISIYPNPTQDKFTIAYHLDESSPVTIVITNILGQTVGIIGNNEMQDAGDHTTSFSPVSPGLYIVRCVIGNSIYTEKVTKY